MKKMSNEKLTVSLQVYWVESLLCTHNQPILVNQTGGQGVLDHSHLVVHYLLALVHGPKYKFEIFTKSFQKSANFFEASIFLNIIIEKFFLLISFHLNALSL